MPVKIDPDIVEELRAMDLLLWECRHPKQPFFNEKTGKMSSREDKGWCLVQLAGPGVSGECRAGAPTLRQAVDTALAYYFPDRIGGLKGALLRLDKALLDLTVAIRGQKMMVEEGYDGDWDDFIPF